MIIYLETNSIMSIAKGRNKELADFVYQSSDKYKFVIPSICLMETLVAIEREEKRNQAFSQTIQIEMNEGKRNKELANSASFVNYLELCLIDNGKLLRDFRNRFLKILAYLKNHGELIEPRIEMLENTLNAPLIPGKNQNRDDFILQVILAHAENNLAIPKVFFSENTKDFANTNIQQIFTSLGINYFSKIANLQGWLYQ
ncbi:MAG: DUF4935 domain-containing protein [Sphaerospermopsis sp. SIO1G2]|nr:DUF4935 domain-containing protein [Sphaerospermopsis sp. SIO1G1]NET73315.1 DUF4935 domain-containing protein [Sphaerospermopsis sp. SIO1G2]